MLVRPLVKWAKPLRLIDIPDIRKVHETPMPRVGGIAIILGSTIPVLIWIELSKEIISILMGIFLIMIFGVWDDRSNIDYRIKFFGQILAVSMPVFVGGIVINNMPFFYFESISIYISAPLTLIFLVAITNAINLSDGLDGLAGGVTLITLGAIAFLAFLSDSIILLMFALSVCGGVFGFLRHNTHPASIFMGDTGSQYLGYVLGVLTVLLTQDINRALSPVLLILLLGVPILDTLTVMALRLREGKSPFSPDKKHLHHKLLSSGFRHYQAVTIIYTLQLIFVGSALFLRYENDYILSLIYILSCLFVFGLLSASKNSVFKEKISRYSSVVEHLSSTFYTRYISRPVFINILLVPTSLYLVYLSISVTHVPIDMGVLSTILLVLLTIRLLFGYKVWFFYLRLLIYVTIILGIYLNESYGMSLFIDDKYLDYVVFGYLTLAMIFVVRSHMSAVFKFTPTDFLVLILLALITFLPESIKDDYHVVSVMIKAVILFYVSEVLMKAMRHRWSMLPISCLMCLSVISLKAILT